MAKSKHKNELEHLKGTVRQLKSVIRSLKENLYKPDKKRRHVNELNEDLATQLIQDEEQDKILINDNKCPNCPKGKLETIDLNIKKMIICNECNFRKLEKKV